MGLYVCTLYIRRVQRAKAQKAGYRMNSILYQVLHPWHWLTYGQNATALGVVVAILGAIVLFFYTLYTRRMMKMQSRTMEIQAQTMSLQVQAMDMQRQALQMQESAAIAAITPKLVAQGDVEFVPSQLDDPEGADIGLVPRSVTEYRCILRIRNVGAGAALFLKGWSQQVTDKFLADNSDLLVNTNETSQFWARKTELMTGESTSITFEDFKPGDLQRRWIFVVDTIDQINRKHQLQLLRTPRANGQTDVSVSMHHQKGELRSKS